MKETALKEEGEHSYLKDQTFLTTFDTSNYKIILINSNYYNDLYYQDPLWDRDYKAMLSRIIVLVVILILSIILLLAVF